MRVLIACEFSGVVRDAFADRGHEAWSIDLLECEKGEESGFHHMGDVLEHIPQGFGAGWDLMIAFPPCTHLAVSGARYFAGKVKQQRESISFVEALWNAGVSRIAIENPVGILSTQSILGKPTQIIQPYQFGHDASKKTCLWLKNLAPLRPTSFVEPRLIGGKNRWANQTDSGQNKLAPSPTRAADRARTYQGIANAMAEQWG